MGCPKALLRTGIAPAARAQLLGSLLRMSYCCSRAKPRQYSIRCSLEPPDVPRLADTARISLTAKEVQEFAPKIRQMIDWFDASNSTCHFILRRHYFHQPDLINMATVYAFLRFGQLQAVDLESIEPTLRADTAVGNNLRPDSAVIFENRDAMLQAVPSYNEPYIKVPRVLNKE